MKLGRLIQYNRNTFVEKSYPKCGGETIPRLFSKIEFISNVLHSFYCMLIWGLSKYSETKLQTTCFYLIVEQISPTFHQTFFLHVWWNVGWKITCFIWRIFWFAHIHLTFHPAFERSFIHKLKFKVNWKWRKKFGYHQY